MPVSEALSALSRRLGMAKTDALSAIFVRWEALVGASVAAHVRPLKLDGRTLVVAADHPAWATQIRHLAPEILARLANECDASEAPERLEVRVRA